ncbi:hypothetical protein K9M09_01580 [Patescibacteria group bacterium]|nr:hypothetical protein [Patescibacteria group bacterium]
MKKLAKVLFVAGIYSWIILFFGILFIAIFIFDNVNNDASPGEFLFDSVSNAASPGEFLIILRNKTVLTVLVSLSAYTILIYLTAEAKDFKIKNPPSLMKALDYRGWKIVFAILATIPLLFVKGVRLIHKSKFARWAQNSSYAIVEELS